ncbi:hypothetical protein CW667_02385 [Candidatus Bathyarchaeota archaeon]|nr:MAG: hypothetical protein CW667_02385 [Candidatus Bathyarchaeota archaeon]RLI17493.1 MAG: hypothetical protein DRO44_03405 [Candidatus Bathyarchaeota archaeon]HDD69818.1 hypothetical protein [Candidatus Bathyarchaeota archaeon]
MSEYPPGSREDREMLVKMPMEKLLDFFFLQIRNLWRVDGLYFLGIEKKFGTDAATEIDAGVWEIMAKIEAKSLRKVFQVGENPDIPTIIELLQKSSWALDQPFKTFEVSDKRATLSIDRCRTQEARLKKGLSEFPCKKVRFGYLKNFAKTLNPKVEVNCLVCPPDKHPKDLWCKWEFKLP